MFRGRVLGRGATGAAAVLMAVMLASCSGAGGAGGVGGPGGGSGSQTINVLMVNNPQMIDLQKLAPTFEQQTGIKVNFSALPENAVRDKIRTSFSQQDGQFDVASVSNYETPIFAKNGWLSDLESVAQDPSFDQQDVLPGLSEGLTYDGKLYAEPFLGDSSFMMYRKDVFEKAGLTMPAHPTWPQIADLAARADGAQPGMKGICLRGLPGWGELGAPLSTLVNTFGGTWYDKDWNAQVTAPEFKEAVSFYVDLVREHGEAGAAQAGFAECLSAFQQGKVAMWYDDTQANPEAAGSPIIGKVGYAAAPVVKTKSSGWLYAWSWAVQKAGPNQEAAKRFIAWASSKEYEELVGKNVGWTSVPAGKRKSTFANPDYLKANPESGPVALAELENADPNNPGVQPRPAPGVHFLAIPEWTSMATDATREISGAIAGKQSVDEALEKSQKIAQAVGDKYKGT